MRTRQRRYALPDRWMMTDERVAEDRLIRAAEQLPRGSGVVFRHYGLPEGERRALFGRLKRIARRRGLMLFLAGDATLAANWGADGSHNEPSRRRGLLLSMAVHDRAQLRRAERWSADMLFLSPLFATRSHPGARPLGAYRFAMLARGTHIPVMALGGVAPRHGTLIRRLGAHGFGAIDAWTR